MTVPLTLPFALCSSSFPRTNSAHPLPPPYTSSLPRLLLDFYERQFSGELMRAPSFLHALEHLHFFCIVLAHPSPLPFYAPLGRASTAVLLWSGGGDVSPVATARTPLPFFR